MGLVCVCDLLSAINVSTPRRSFPSSVRPWLPVHNSHLNSLLLIMKTSRRTTNQRDPSRPRKNKNDADDQKRETSSSIYNNIITFDFFYSLVIPICGLLFLKQEIIIFKSIISNYQRNKKSQSSELLSLQHQLNQY